MRIGELTLATVPSPRLHKCGRAGSLSLDSGLSRSGMGSGVGAVKHSLGDFEAAQMRALVDLERGYEVCKGLKFSNLQ